MGLFDDAVKQMLAEEDRKVMISLLQAANPQPYEVMVDWFKAVVEFLKHRNGDLCHDRRGELAKAFGLEDKLETTISFEEFCHGCTTYQRGLFGKSDRETVFNALSDALRPDIPAAELADVRTRFIAVFGEGLWIGLLELRTDQARLTSLNRLVAATESRDSYWAWGDDGHDHPESLSCPVMVQPHVVRRWVAVEEMLRKVLDSGYLRASGTIHIEARELLAKS